MAVGTRFATLIEGSNLAFRPNVEGLPGGYWRAWGTTQTHALRTVVTLARRSSIRSELTKARRECQLRPRLPLRHRRRRAAGAIRWLAAQTIHLPVAIGLVGDQKVATSAE